jgi:hypothetical protein
VVWSRAGGGKKKKRPAPIVRPQSASASVSASVSVPAVPVAPMVGAEGRAERAADPVVVVAPLRTGGVSMGSGAAFSGSGAGQRG